MIDVDNMDPDLGGKMFTVDDMEPDLGRQND